MVRTSYPQSRLFKSNYWLNGKAAVLYQKVNRPMILFFQFYQLNYQQTQVFFIVSIFRFWAKRRIFIFSLALHFHSYILYTKIDLHRSITVHDFPPGRVIIIEFDTTSCLTLQWFGRRRLLLDSRARRLEYNNIHCTCLAFFDCREIKFFAIHSYYKETAILIHNISLK